MSKDDPNTIVICRSFDAFLALSVNETRAQWQPGGPAVYLGSESGPLTVQITNGKGQTAIVFIHNKTLSDQSDRLVVHGHVEGAKHTFGWRKVGGKLKKFTSLARKLRIHVGADGNIKLTPDAEFYFIAADGSELEFPYLEFKIPMFGKSPGF